MKEKRFQTTHYEEMGMLAEQWQNPIVSQIPQYPLAVNYKNSTETKKIKVTLWIHLF